MSANECDAIRPLISAALDGELDEGEFVQLSEHLASCPSCRQIHHDYSNLRDGLRASSAPPPPPHLARSVRRETVEKPPPPLIIRFASRAGLKFGMSTMAVSIIAVIVVALFAAHGYDQRSIPAIASSQPAQGTVQDWPVSRPVEIEFDKQMDRESVEENLIIRPTAEQERLPTSWSGNTLIIGRSETHSVLLRPETDYRITILEHARDRHGNPIGDFWVLQFRTGPPDVAVATPSVESHAADSGTDDGAQSNDDSSQSDQTERSDSVDTDSHQADPSSVPSENQAESGESNEDASLAEAEQPQETSPPDQSAESSSGTSSEPEQQQPTATPTPEPTATPQPEPTPELTATPTPKPDPPTAPAEPYPVRGAFGEVYWGNSAVQQALGAPVQEARSFLASEQEFQRGLMFRQHFGNQNAIFVFVNDGQALNLDHDFDPSRHNYPVQDQGDGFFIPGGYFGRIWVENPSLQDQMGFAVSSEPVRDIDGASQRFDGGLLIYSRGYVYVIYADKNWDVFKVRTGSSGGFQSTDDGDSESRNSVDGQGESESDDTGTASDSDPAPTPASGGTDAGSSGEADADD